MVESGLEPSYEDGVEFTEVSGSYLIWVGSRISKLANVSFGFQRQISFCRIIIIAIHLFALFDNVFVPGISLSVVL